MAFGLAILGELLPFCQGGGGVGTLFSYFFICFEFFYTLAVGLGIGLNWLNRVKPSLTQLITDGVLYKMREQILYLFLSSYAGRFSCSTI